MSERKTAPGLAFALEYGPLLLFFIGVVLLKDKSFMLFGAERSGFILMSVVLVPLLIVSTFVLWRLTGEVSAMQIITLVLVTALAAMGFWLNDPRFLKIKPTIVYLLFAAVLGFGLLRGRSYLQLVMGKNLKMQDIGWMILTKRFALMFVVMAVVNEVVWRTTSDATWAAYKLFGTMAILFVFMLTQARLLETYAEKDSAPQA